MSDDWSSIDHLSTFFCMPVVLMSWLDLEQFGVAGWMIAGNT